MADSRLAPHVQPWEHRVTMRVNLEDMNLLTTPLEHQILHELVGPRMKGNVLQLSSNQFGSRIENKRHLVSMLDRIVSGGQGTCTRHSNPNRSYYDDHYYYYYGQYSIILTN
jgi:hypothetical protein